MVFVYKHGRAVNSLLVKQVYPAELAEAVAVQIEFDRFYTEFKRIEKYFKP